MKWKCTKQEYGFCAKLMVDLKSAKFQLSKIPSGLASKLPKTLIGNYLTVHEEGKLLFSHFENQNQNQSFIMMSIIIRV